jgi:hypothetical protein
MKMRESHLGLQAGENHPHWKGALVGYAPLHQWIKRNKEKTGKCSTCGHCGKTEWANISGVYLRDLNDFAEMCHACHSEFDDPEWWRNL